MSTTRNAKPEATEPVSFRDQADSLASDPASLAVLIDQATDAKEAEYVFGLMTAADASAEAMTVDQRINRYRHMGHGLVVVTRQRINTGLATTTKGVTRTPLASGSPVTFADVRDAIGVRQAGDTWTPLGGKPVGRTECQRYWEAAGLTADDIAKAKAIVPEAKANNAKAIVEAAAEAKRDAGLDPKAAAAKAAKAEATEAARSDRKAKADRETERTKAARVTMVETKAEPLVSDIVLATASLPVLLATLDAVSAAIDTAHATAEAVIATAEAEAEADAKMADALGVSVDEIRAMREAKAAAEAAAA